MTIVPNYISYRKTFPVKGVVHNGIYNLYNTLTYCNLNHYEIPERVLLFYVNQKSCWTQQPKLKSPNKFNINHDTVYLR